MKPSVALSVLAPLVAASALIGPPASAAVATTAAASTTQPIFSLTSTMDPTLQRGQQYFADDGDAQLDPTSSLTQGITVAIPASSVSITIRPPFGAALKVGDYTGLDSSNDNGTTPMATIAIAGTAQPYVGNLDILDLATSAAGALQRFDVVFDNAHAASPGALFGEVRMGEPTTSGVDVAAQVLEWPATVVKSTPIVATEWLHNTGTSAAAIGHATVTAGATGDYAITADRCSGTTLAAGARCSFKVGFSPTTGGPRNATLSFGIGSATQTISLAGYAPLGTSSITTSGNDPVDSGQLGGAKSHAFPDGPYQIVQDANLGFTAYIPYSGGFQPGGQDNMKAEIWAPSTGVTTGTHPADYPFVSGQYGVYVTAFNVGCSTYRGTENLTALTRGASPYSLGNYSMLDVSFVISCDSATSSPMTGKLLWQYRADTTAPAPVTNLAITSPSTAPVATWTKSTSSDATSTIARLLPGDGTNATPTSGYGLSDGTANSASLPSLNPGEPYTVAVFAVDSSGNVSAVSETPITQGTSAPPVELLADPGFESGTSGWSVFTSGTLTRVATPVHGGKDSLQVAAVSAAAGLVGLTQNSVVPNSVAGTAYTASCWVRPGTAGRSVTMRLLEYTQSFSSDIHLPSTTATLPAATWTKISVTGTAVKTGERIVPQVYSTNETTTTGVVDYDDCSVTTG